MKPTSIFAILVLLTGLLLSFSCTKETSCENCRVTNKPPIPIAGPDQVITLPTDSVLPDGSTSCDTGGEENSNH